MTLQRTKQDLRKKDHFEKAYPAFVKGPKLQTLPESSQALQMDLRPNTFLLRPYSPEGFTSGGLYVRTNEHNARVWGFVLAISESNRHRLVPGDLIVFERHYDMLLVEDESRESQNKQPISILHEDCVVAVIRNNRLPVPM